MSLPFDQPTEPTPYPRRGSKLREAREARQLHDAWVGAFANIVEAEQAFYDAVRAVEVAREAAQAETSRVGKASPVVPDPRRTVQTAEDAADDQTGRAIIGGAAVRATDAQRA
jgi:hypothetical protein